MKTVTANFLAALLLLAGAQAVEKAPGFDTFRLMRTRNMFDPGRRPARTDTASAARTVAAPQSRNSTLSLTGTMVTEGKTLAFFNGTRSDYAKVLAVGGAVADCKITAIHPTQVEIERGGKASVLAVGQQLVIEGAPSDAPPPEPAPATAAEPAPGAAPGDPAAPAPAVSNDKSEVLRRMMERREKEMNK